MADDHGTIWVQSDVTPDGTYAATIHYSGDRSRILDRDAALAYAATIHDAAIRAEHDAAVLAQLVATGMPLALAAGTLADLRKDRPPLDDQATAPLRLAPGVSGRTKEAFLAVEIDGKVVGQWTPGDARDHASNALAVVAAVDLDAAYRRWLIGKAGLAADRASAAVGDLAAYIAAYIGKAS
jgi:hypothetical protein